MKVFPLPLLAHFSNLVTSCRYLELAKRYNYTTAKSYLELIALFKSLLASKRAQLGANKARLQSGVEKISQASAQVPFFLLAAMTALPSHEVLWTSMLKEAQIISFVN